jgi:hypothetical protein
MKRTLDLISLLLLAAPLAHGHRLDEYLQGTLMSIEKNNVQVHMTLTPGVIVLPFLLADFDRDADGSISAAEQHAYASRVLHDLSLTIDGHLLVPELRSVQFPTVEEMRDGRGEIQIDFAADLPAGGPNRKLSLENRHQSRIAAYQVNVLVPRDPDIRIVAQIRNYTQSRYELDYLQNGARPVEAFLAWSSDFRLWLSVLAFLLLLRLALLWRRHMSYGTNARYAK